MKPVNRNTATTGGKDLPKMGNKLTDAANEGRTVGGHMLVPAHPTPEMLGAFWRTKNTGTTEIGGAHQDSSDVAAYQAMVAAAPKPDPLSVARALADAALRASPAQADLYHRLAAALVAPGFGEVRRG